MKSRPRIGRPPGPEKLRVEIRLERALFRECRERAEGEFQPSVASWVVATIKRALGRRRKK